VSARHGGHIGYEIRPSQRRRGYGTEILRLTLEKAREWGLRKVLVTSDATNRASRRIIEANGGVFESEVEVESGAKKERRYWVAIFDPSCEPGD
jgi:predicted acetyltransferase